MQVRGTELPLRMGILAFPQACRKSLTDESDDGPCRSYSPFQHSDLFIGSLKSLRYFSMLVVLSLLLAPRPLNRLIYEV